jgi:hypothetical protein
VISPPLFSWLLRGRNVIERTTDLAARLPIADGPYASTRSPRRVADFFGGLRSEATRLHQLLIVPFSTGD